MKHFKTGFVALVCLIFWAYEGEAYLLENNCGTIRQPSRFKRVVGGQDAEIFSNPWLAILLQDQKYRCTGSLVTSRKYLSIILDHCNSVLSLLIFTGFVLTAGFCFRYIELAPTYDLSIIFIINILILWVLERYVWAIMTGIKRTIVLHWVACRGPLILISSVYYIRPICLLVNQPLLKQFSSFIVAGWADYNKVIKTVLQTAIVANRDIEECKSLQLNNLFKDLICAGDTTSDTCEGDMGNPLTGELLYGGVPRIFQFGISNFGFSACFVLTVADCFNESNSAPTKVRLGDYDRNKTHDCSSLGCLPRTSDIDIERAIPHPQYNITGINENNIALVRIAEEILFSDYIRPICLLVNQPVLKKFLSFKVAGWGHYNEVMKRGATDSHCPPSRY
ncbi:serine protease 48-like [Drosophila eugracilis]|uniref:serine protease 48-like n=1 Tax=Drosophila eugracilis TaxID=29029 RepID=UPI001BDB0147|nr:serine protease 48-like [Drosophila eugracilis]